MYTTTDYRGQSGHPGYIYICTQQPPIEVNLATLVIYMYTTTDYRGQSGHPGYIYVHNNRL